LVQRRDTDGTSNLNEENQADGDDQAEAAPEWAVIAAGHDARRRDRSHRARVRAEDA
jgi:hypothetical protein